MTEISRYKRRRKNHTFRNLVVLLMLAVMAVCIWSASAKGSFSFSKLIEDIEDNGVAELSYDEENWNLILVNEDNPLPEDYEISLRTLNGGEQVDERIYPELQQMFDAMRADGVYPHINSAYRTAEKQQQLLDEKAQEYIVEGYDGQEAVSLARLLVSEPGISEHQLGLALDITVEDNTDCTVEDVQQWLMDYAHKYGFIMRYPATKTEITGYSYEPWHYRYVGKEAAKYIYEHGLCLEEYLDER